MPFVWYDRLTRSRQRVYRQSDDIAPADPGARKTLHEIRARFN